MMSQTNTELPVAPPARTAPRENLERTLAAVIILLALALQVCAALRGGAIGQDFEIHYKNMLLAAAEPLRWMFGAYPRTNPPLFYCFAGLIFDAVGKEAWPYVIGIVN